jgi:hypothetical protein
MISRKSKLGKVKKEVAFKKCPFFKGGNYSTITNTF